MGYLQNYANEIIPSGEVRVLGIAPDISIVIGDGVTKGGILFASIASNVMRLAGEGLLLSSLNANGQSINTKMLSELTTIAAAATSSTVIQIPANTLVLGVSVRVTVVIPTATTFDIGVTGATTRYGTGIAVAAGTTKVSPGTTNPTIYSSAVSLLITPNGTPGAATGRVRTTIHYLDITPPTS